MNSLTGSKLTTKFDMLLDAELVNRVKTENCSDSLQELINRHTPLCYDIYRRYFPSLKSVGISINDLNDEKDFYVYKSASSFKPEKNVKFSTWLGNHIRYQCLNALNKKN